MSLTISPNLTFSSSLSRPYPHAPSPITRKKTSTAQTHPRDNTNTAILRLRRANRPGPRIQAPPNGPTSPSPFPPSLTWQPPKKKSTLSDAMPACPSPLPPNPDPRSPRHARDACRCPHLDGRPSHQHALAKPNDTQEGRTPLSQPANRRPTPCRPQSLPQLGGAVYSGGPACLSVPPPSRVPPCLSIPSSPLPVS